MFLALHIIVDSDIRCSKLQNNFHKNSSVARADADRQVHQAQALWSACSALWSSMRTVDSKQTWQNQLRPLKSEVEAVRKASGEYRTISF